MTKKLLLLSSLFFVLTSYSQEYTQIPDANFEQALIDLDIDSDGLVNGQVLTSNISGITSLNVTDKSISNLAGIEDFISLEKLQCGYNKITSLNLRYNTALKYIECYVNNLTSLNLTQSISLIELHGGDNQLTNLDVTQNINLKTLNLNSNYFTKLDLSKNSELVFLYSNSNLLKSLDVSQNLKLSYLNCSYNQLTSLDVSKNSELVFLYSSSNLLTSMDITQNFKLTNLKCADNQLTSLDVSKSSNLIVINCAVNQITNLDISENLNLGFLNCSNNRISSLDASKNSSLEEFECQNNELISLNIKNGNNEILFAHPTNPHTYTDGFVATNNPALTCVQVDDETSANNGIFPYDVWQKDDIAIYSEDCASVLGIDDELLVGAINFYPNPVTNILIVDSEIPLIKVEIYSILGQLIKEVNSDFNSISTNNLSKGIYLVRMYSDKGTTVRKLIKQ